MKRNSKKILTLALVAGFVANLTACGTILYPERKGQTDGRVDIGVVALDAIGLLFWFIPGVIAFAVDFSNGTIYLPGGERAQLSDEEMNEVVTDKGKVDQQKLNKLVAAKAKVEGDDVDWSELKAQSLNSTAELERYLQRPMQISSL